MPEYTAQASGIGTLRLLDAIKNLKLRSKFYQASTSELFGGIQNRTPIRRNAFLSKIALWFQNYILTG